MSIMWELKEALRQWHNSRDPQFSREILPEKLSDLIFRHLILRLDCFLIVKAEILSAGGRMQMEIDYFILSLPSHWKHSIVLIQKWQTGWPPNFMYIFVLIRYINDICSSAIVPCYDTNANCTSKFIADVYNNDWQLLMTFSPNSADLLQQVICWLLHPENDRIYHWYQNISNLLIFFQRGKKICFKRQ